LNNITLVLLGAGNSTRFGLKAKKQWLYIGDDPLWYFVTKQFKSYGFKETIIVSSLQEIEYMKKFDTFTFVEGGETRQESLKNALQNVSTKYVLVSDIARCCIDHDMIKRILENREKADCIVPALNVSDTLYMDNSPADRESAKLIQTPQLSETKLLLKAIQSDEIFTDDSSAMHKSGNKILFVEGSQNAHKLTFADDLKKLVCLKPPSQKTFVGFGIDTHPFEQNKPMYLCGEMIENSFGFKAHSDGDVAIHAIIDALLGAAGLGDIGEFFPDTDNQYKDIDSKELLKICVDRINAYGFDINNVDITILAEIPKISPHKEKMRQTLSKILGINQRSVNIKATTSEKLGFIGRCEGVSVHAVATLSYFNWTKL
jgi:2-C-methyl-D-erythritol 4-phosphate cytidylyltransferase / 2-C-methyl-D-erythritol 2,4-cyclodiphosphate synthase